MANTFDKPLVTILDTRTLEDPAAFQEAYAKVAPSRQKKVNNCRFPKDKRLCLGAGLLFVQELQKLGIFDAQIAYADSGKPYIANHPEVFFNLSHSGQYAACAFYHKEIGIDVQQIVPVSDPLIQKIAVQEEAATILQLSQEAKEEAFAKLWTIKESYLKYIGSGLRVSPKRLTYFDGLFLDGTPVNVTLETTQLPGHIMTLCY